ncbi:MAG: hypothetical protein ACTSR9_16695 [Candidatus Thorarchaeota archaeon]
MTDESLTVRPTLSETSGWDKDNPRFDLLAPGLNWATAPGSILRHQVVRGRNINIEIDWTDANLATGSEVFINAQVEVWGDSLWINQTLVVPSGNITVLTFDIGHLVNRPDDGMALWVSDNQTLSTPPSVTVWAYREDPSTLNDIVSVVRNLINADRYFIRMQYEEDYIDTYLETISAQETEANSMKGWYIVLGAAMIAAAPFTAGTSAIWGLDMIVGVTTGKSMFDHFLHGAMRLFGVDENYIGNFSIWGITSNQGWNLILTEALASAMSFGIGSAAKGIGRLAGRLGSSLGTRFATGRLGGLVKLGSGLKSKVATFLDDYFGTSFENILSFGWSESIEKLSKKGFARAAGTVVLKGVAEYCELVGEVIFEMAFDSMLRFDRSARPAGGGEVFISAMTLSVITSALMKRMGTKGIDVVRTDKGLSVKSSRSRLILPSLALSLQISMLVMRIPVIAGNIK